jgi:hypothetical protein
MTVEFWKYSFVEDMVEGLKTMEFARGKLTMLVSLAWSSDANNVDVLLGIWCLV